MKRVFILLFLFQLSCVFADDEYFEGAGKAYGTLVWKFDSTQKEAQIWFSRSSNIFYEEDAYVSLVTTKLRDVTGWNLSIWLGNDVQNENILNALRFAVKLAERFRKDETLYLEMQGKESALFMSTFPDAFETIRHATSDPPKLYLVKGKENIWAVRIPAEISSLNQEDCFLLDPGNMYDVFLLCGKGASSKEKETARKLGKAILVKQHNDPWGELKTLDGNFNPDANDSVSKAFIENLEQSTQEDKDIFWNYGEDSDFEKKREAEILLYKISDDEDAKDDEDDEEDVYGELLRGAQLTNNVLIPSECLVVDTNSVAGIQVYIGESAGPGVTFKALTQALATAASRATSLNVDKNEVDKELKYKIHILHHKRVPRTPDFVFNSIELTKEYLKYEDPAAALSEAVEKTTLE